MSCLSCGSQRIAKLHDRPMAYAIALEVVTPSLSSGTTRRVGAKHLPALFRKGGSGSPHRVSAISLTGRSRGRLQVRIASATPSGAPLN